MATALPARIMSKASKPRDRWHQVFSSATDREGHCPGCGYYLAVYHTHRVDCTSPESVAQREQTGQGHCPDCNNTVDLTLLVWNRTRWQCNECHRTWLLAGCQETNS